MWLVYRKSEKQFVSHTKKNTNEIQLFFLLLIYSVDSELFLLVFHNIRSCWSLIINKYNPKYTRVDWHLLTYKLFIFYFVYPNFDSMTNTQTNTLERKLRRKLKNRERCTRWNYNKPIKSDNDIKQRWTTLRKYITSSSSSTRRIENKF